MCVGRQRPDGGGCKLQPSCFPVNVRVMPAQDPLHAGGNTSSHQAVHSHCAMSKMLQNPKPHLQLFEHLQLQRRITVERAQLAAHQGCRHTEDRQDLVPQ